MRTLLSPPHPNPAAVVSAPAEGCGSSQDGHVAERSAELSEYCWRNRLILLVAAWVDDPAYTEQQDMLKAVTEGLSERHIIVPSEKDPAAHGTLRARFEPLGFELLLVG
jgi:hypothetical protein